MAAVVFSPKKAVKAVECLNFIAQLSDALKTGLLLRMPVQKAERFYTILKELAKTHMDAEAEEVDDEEEVDFDPNQFRLSTRVAHPVPKAAQTKLAFRELQNIVRMITPRSELTLHLDDQLNVSDFLSGKCNIDPAHVKETGIAGAILNALSDFQAGLMYARDISRRMTQKAVSKQYGVACGTIRTMIHYASFIVCFPGFLASGITVHFLLSHREQVLGELVDPETYQLFRTFPQVIHMTGSSGSLEFQLSFPDEYVGNLETAHRVLLDLSTEDCANVAVMAQYNTKNNPSAFFGGSERAEAEAERNMKRACPFTQPASKAARREMDDLARGTPRELEDLERGTPRREHVEQPPQPAAAAPPQPALPPRPASTVVEKDRSPPRKDRSPPRKGRSPSRKDRARSPDKKSKSKKGDDKGDDDLEKVTQGVAAMDVSKSRR